MDLHTSRPGGNSRHHTTGTNSLWWSCSHWQGLQWPCNSSALPTSVVVSNIWNTSWSKSVKPANNWHQTNQQLTSSLGALGHDLTLLQFLVNRIREYIKSLVKIILEKMCNLTEVLKGWYKLSESSMQSGNVHPSIKLYMLLTVYTCPDWHCLTFFVKFIQACMMEETG